MNPVKYEHVNFICDLRVGSYIRWTPKNCVVEIDTDEFIKSPTTIDMRKGAVLKSIVLTETGPKLLLSNYGSHRLFTVTMIDNHVFQIRTNEDQTIFELLISHKHK